MLKLILRIYISISLEFMQRLKVYSCRFQNTIGDFVTGQIRGFARVRRERGKKDRRKNPHGVRESKFRVRRSAKAGRRSGVPVDTHYESFKN